MSDQNYQQPKAALIVDKQMREEAANMLSMIRNHQYGLRGFGDGSLSRGRNLTDRERSTICWALRVASEQTP